MTERKDRRSQHRVVCRFPLKYREIRDTPPLFRGTQVQNFSRGGLLHRTEEFLPLNTGMILEFRLPTSPKPIRAISKVCWTKKLPESDSFEVGNEFLDLTREEREVISAYLGDRQPA